MPSTRAIASAVVGAALLAGCAGDAPGEFWPALDITTDLPVEAEYLSDQLSGADTILVGEPTAVAVTTRYPDEVPSGQYNSFAVIVTVDGAEGEKTVRYTMDFGGEVAESDSPLADPERLSWDANQEMVFVVTEDPTGAADYVCITASFLCPLYVKGGAWHSPVAGPDLDTWLAGQSPQPSSEGSPYDSIRNLPGNQ